MAIGALVWALKDPGWPRCVPSSVLYYPCGPSPRSHHTAWKQALSGSARAVVVPQALAESHEQAEKSRQGSARGRNTCLEHGLGSNPLRLPDQLSRRLSRNLLGVSRGCGVAVNAPTREGGVPLLTEPHREGEAAEMSLWTQKTCVSKKGP